MKNFKICVVLPFALFQASFSAISSENRYAYKDLDNFCISGENPISIVSKSGIAVSELESENSTTRCIYDSCQLMEYQPLTIPSIIEKADAIKDENNTVSLNIGENNLISRNFDAVQRETSLPYAEQSSTGDSPEITNVTRFEHIFKNVFVERNSEMDDLSVPSSDNSSTRNEAHEINTSDNVKSKNNSSSQNTEAVNTAKQNINEIKNLKRFNKNVREPRLSILTRFLQTGDIRCITKLSTFLTLPPDIIHLGQKQGGGMRLVDKVAHELRQKIAPLFKLLYGDENNDGKYNVDINPLYRGRHPGMLRSILTLTLVRNCLMGQKLWYYIGRPTGSIMGWIPKEFYEKINVSRTGVYEVVEMLDEEINNRITLLNNTIHQYISRVFKNSNSMKRVKNAINDIRVKINDNSWYLNNVIKWGDEQGGRSLKEIIENEIILPMSDIKNQL